MGPCTNTLERLRYARQADAFALVGIDAMPVEVEVDTAAGLPKTILVGLPELAVARAFTGSSGPWRISATSGRQDARS